MDDTGRSIESANPSSPRGANDEWLAVRELLAAQQAAIAAMESQLVAGAASSSEQTEQVARDAARLTALMDDLVRREAELESGRRELTEAKKSGRKPARDEAVLDAQRQELVRHEDELAAELERLAGQQADLDQRAAELAAAGEELDREKAELARQHQQLAADRALAQVEKAELESRQAQLARDRQRVDVDREKLDADLDRLAGEQAAARISAERVERSKQQFSRQTTRFDEQRKQLETQRAALAQERTDLKLAQEAAKACQAEFARAHQRLETEREQLSLERDRLVALESDTKNQRRRIAREFRVQHKTHLDEMESRREELESLVTATETELQSLTAATNEERKDELAIVQAEERELRERLSQLGKVLNARADELRTLRAQVNSLNDERGQLIDELTQARHDLASHQDALVVESIGAASADEAAPLRAERDALAARLAVAQKQLESGGFTDNVRGDLQRRFEMAVQDLREQKERNIDLEHQLARVSAGAASAAGGAVAPLSAGAGGGDWESQKRFLLQSLEAEVDDEDNEIDDQRSQIRMSIEATIRITDEVVAQKDREIAELRHMLDDQASNIGSVAIGAAAIDGIFDQDELIAQERARLAQAQAELREKLRQAEIDISVQRASIARERANIDEKLANHQSHLDRLKDSTNALAGKPHRRWLSRLGLKENEE